MEAFKGFAKWLAQVTGSILFLQSNTFSWAASTAEEIYLLGEKEVERQLGFAKRTITIPVIMALVAMIVGYVGGVQFGWEWPHAFARAVIILAAVICGVGLLLVWCQATLFAHLLVAGSRFGFAAAHAVTSVAGKALGSDLATKDSSGPLAAEHAERFAAWLRNIVAYLAVVCMAVAILPIWKAPLTTGILTVAVIALAMFMASGQSVWPRRIAVTSVLLIVIGSGASLQFPTHTERALQMVAGASVLHSTAEKVLIQRKVDELHTERLAIRVRALKAEKPFATDVDRQRHAAIENLLEQYQKDLCNGSTDSCDPNKPAGILGTLSGLWSDDEVADEDDTQGAASVHAVPATISTAMSVSSPATLPALPPEQIAPPQGIASIAPSAPAVRAPIPIATTLAESRRVSDPAVGDSDAVKRARDLLRQHGR